MHSLRNFLSGEGPLGEDNKNMEQCEFCGASLPANASFCGKCGRVPQRVSIQPTHAGARPNLDLADDPDFSNRPTLQLKNDLNDNEATIISTSGMDPTPETFISRPPGLQPPMTSIPIENAETE